MDMDQRTRILGRGSNTNSLNGGRVILLGDGTEILTGADAANDEDEDDGDVDMEDRGDEEGRESEEEEKDLEEQVRKGQGDAKQGSFAKAAEGSESVTEGNAGAEKGEGKENAPTEAKKAEADGTPEESKMAAASDSTDMKKVMESQDAGKGPIA